MTDNHDDHHVLPIVEEQAVVGRTVRESGVVRIQQTASEHQTMAEGSVDRTSAEVERVPVNRIVESVPEIRTEGDLLYIPVVEEELVVTKRLVLREEIVVRRSIQTQTVQVPVTLRRTDVTVERIERDAD